MDKTKIASIALEARKQTDEYLASRIVAPEDWAHADDLEFATRFLARVREEEEKDAVAVVDECDECQFAEILPNVNVRVGDKLFLHPQEESNDVAIALLRSALIGLIGADTEDELKQMEAVIRTLPAPEADKTVSINAIHALLATIPKPPAAKEQAND